MSVLGDFRKLLFGAKAVAASAANKAVEAGKEAGEELVEKSNEFIEKASEKAGELYEKASGKADELYQAAKEKVDDITESIWKTAETNSETQAPVQTSPPPKDAGEFVASTILETPIDETPADDSLEMKEDLAAPTPTPEKDFLTKTGERVLETASEVGSKFAEKSAELGEKVKEVAQTVGTKLAEKGSEAIDKAKEIGGQLKDKFDSLVEKAGQEAEKDRLEQEAIKAAAAQQEAEWQKRAADKNAESTLGGMDSFFEKASRFADGDYHNTGSKKPLEDDPNVLELRPDPDYKKEKKDNADDLIDDAIIDDKN